MIIWESISLPKLPYSAVCCIIKSAKINLRCCLNELIKMRENSQFVTNKIGTIHHSTETRADSKMHWGNQLWPPFQSISWNLVNLSLIKQAIIIHFSQIKTLPRWIWVINYIEVFFSSESSSYLVTLLPAQSRTIIFAGRRAAGEMSLILFITSIKN